MLRVQIMVFWIVTLAWRDLGKPVQQHILVKTGARQFPVTILWASLLLRHAHWDSSEICLVTFGDKMCEGANTTSLPMYQCSCYAFCANDKRNASFITPSLVTIPFFIRASLDNPLSYWETLFGLGIKRLEGMLCKTKS